MLDKENQIFSMIVRWLRSQDAEFEVREHVPARTSAESAAARGESMSIGAKALLIKCDATFRLFVMPANRRFDSRAARAEFRLRRTRFASREELLEMTGLVPGSVPPFGEPILPFPLHVDEAIAQNDRVAFNAGSLVKSVLMTAESYLAVCGGELGVFSTDSDEAV